MTTSRAKRIKDNVELLIENFPIFLEFFDKKPPFSRYGQFEYHDQAIRQRFSYSSVVDAINDDDFLGNLHRTLRAWGIGTRGSVLAPLAEFRNAIRNELAHIARLDGLKIDDANLNAKLISDQLWQLISSLQIVGNQAKVVACSKALHHLLPELVPPIDRAYTCNFFLWSSTEFQYRQKQFLTLAFDNFAAVARKTNPSQYVGKGWHTSRTKVLDNAIVGYKLLAKQAYQRSRASS